MNRILAILLALPLAVAASAQLSAQDVLTHLQQVEMKAYNDAEASHTAPDYAKIQEQVKQAALDALKSVDPSKLDPKDAFDWAQVYSMAGEHQQACDLSREFLTTNPAPVDRFNAQMLMMRSCSALGEADALEKTLSETHPEPGDQSMQLASFVGDFVDTIDAKKGDKEALDVLGQIQQQVRLQDPKEAAQQQLDAYKKNPSPDSSQTDDQLLKQFAERTQAENDAIQFSFADKKAKLLAKTGHRDQAVAMLGKIADDPATSTSLKHEAAMDKVQVGIVDSAAPSLTSEKSIGGFSNLAALKGKVVIVDFFAHWCGPCMASIPSMESLYADLHPKGLEVVGVTTYYGFFGSDNLEKRDMPKDVELQKLQGLLTDKSIPWPVVVGSKDNFNAYGVFGIPETVIIDKTGKVRYIEIGFGPGSDDKLKTEIEGLLKE